MKKKTESKGLKILLFLLVVLLVIVGVLAMSLRNNAEETHPPKNASERTSQLYLEVTNYDLDNNYPETPEEIMFFFNNTFLLLYGEESLEKTQVKNVISKQRVLYSSYLKAMNNEHEQVESCVSSTKQVREMNNFIISSIQEEAVYDEIDPSKCTISVTRITSLGDKLYYNFYLEKDPTSNKWKISLWENADEFFNPIENTDAPYKK